MAAIKKLDFSKMIFDISKVLNGESVLETFPRLLVYREIEEYQKNVVFYDGFEGQTKRVGKDTGMPTIDKVLIYIFLLYDVRSPFQELKSLPERQDRCLEYAGFQKEKGKWGANVTSLVEGPEMENLARWFLFKVQKNREYNLYTSLQQLFEDTMESIRTRIVELDPQKKETSWKMRLSNGKEASELMKTINALEVDIFQDKDELKQLVTEDKQVSTFRSGTAEMLSDMRSSQ